METLLRITRSARWVLPGLVVLLAAACSGGDADGAASEPSERPEATEVAAADGPLTWRGETQVSGTPVVVYPPEGPVETGDVDFTFEIEEPLPDSAELTVDVFSPAMPGHGVQRMEPESMPDGRYRVTAHLPMEGGWAFWVNLDWGEDAVGWEFDVVPGEDGGHDHAGMNHGQMDPAGTGGAERGDEAQPDSSAGSEDTHDHG